MSSNPSIERTPYSWLRQLPGAAHLERWDSMRTIRTFIALITIICASCQSIAPDKYGANGPCAYLFKKPGGNCLEGNYTLETDVGAKRKVLSSKVINFSTSSQSSGSVLPIAQCTADNMKFYVKWYVKNPDVLGKQIVTIHVVGTNTCPKP